MRFPSLRQMLLGAALTAWGVAAQAADLTVSAAASLTHAFKELAPGFEAQNPGTQVLFNFASSDALLAHIAVLAAGVDDPWEQHTRWLSEALAARG